MRSGQKRKVIGNVTQRVHLLPWLPTGRQPFSVTGPSAKPFLPWSHITIGKPLMSSIEFQEQEVTKADFGTSGILL